MNMKVLTFVEENGATDNEDPDNGNGSDDENDGHKPDRSHKPRSKKRATRMIFRNSNSNKKIKANGVGGE